MYTAVSDGCPMSLSFCRSGLPAVVVRFCQATGPSSIFAGGVVDVKRSVWKQVPIVRTANHARVISPALCAIRQ